MNNVIFTIALMVAVRLVSAQSAFVGTWEGKLNAGMELRVIFQVSKDEYGIFSGLLDCPDQGLKGIKASQIALSADSMIFGIDQFKATYRGKLANDSTISGTFYQGMSFPLNMKKVSKVLETRRYQTPFAPFPYDVEELTYSNSDKSISYGATITIPKGTGPFPAALLLTGSGQQNRDEEVAGHKPFAVIADQLTRNGFIVLRVDDRGIGKTSGDFRTSTSKDFAEDAIVSINYLKGRKEVSQKKIGLIGHSEGGMLAQMIAADRKDIGFVILLAAPGIPTKQLMLDQNEAILRKSGLPNDYITHYLKLYRSIIEVAATTDESGMFENVKRIVDSWVSETPNNIVKTTTAISDESSKINFVKGFVGQVGSPWFKYFLNYDPTNNLKKLNAPVLALNGGDDVQVLAEPNLLAIKNAVEKGRSKRVVVKKLEGLNHLFQECQSCSVAEYVKLEQTISPAALEAISSWLSGI